MISGGLATTAQVFDPVTVEILRTRLHSITQEMGVVLERLSRSYVINEGHHLGAGVFDGEGRMLAVHLGHPSHLWALALSVKQALAKFSFDLEDGDVIIVNDPYHGGTVLPEMTMLHVTLLDGESFLFPAVRVRHTDVGGGHPGGFFPSAIQLYQEGDIISPVRLVKGGNLLRDVLKRLVKNNRTPHLYEADLTAMIAAGRLGQRRIRESFLEFGVDYVVHAAAPILSYAARYLREGIMRWPRGESESRVRLQGRLKGDFDVEVRARLEVSEENILIDFAGTSPELSQPLNCSLASTYAFSTLPILAALGGDVPLNEGILETVKIVAPEGTVVNPKFPAPVSLSGGQLCSLVSEAVEQAIASRIGKARKKVWGILPQVIAFNEEGFLSQMSLVPGGDSASEGQDGWLSPAPLSHQQIPSIEQLELEYGEQFRVLEREIVCDSGGAGQNRGAPGTRTVLSVLRSGVEITAFGPTLQTGGDRIELMREGSEAVQSDYWEKVPLQGGDRLLVEKGGGSGIGPGWKREIHALLEDVKDGYVSTEAATVAYGVVLDPTSLEVDQASTIRRRGEMESAGDKAR